MDKKISDIIESYYDEMIEFAQTLVRIPSLSGEEREAARVVSERLKDLCYDEVFTDAWGNVVGIIDGNVDGKGGSGRDGGGGEGNGGEGKGSPASGSASGSANGPAIMYNGHMDVVTEGDVSEWEGYDPYGAAIDEALIKDRSGDKEERTAVLHGRGSSDMKCGLVSQIYAGAVLIEMRRQGIPWQGRFILTAVTLEENGEAMGTIKLTEGAFKERGINIDAMVCAEPSSLDLKLGHRGRMEIAVTVFGRSCHGSSPWLGINAVEKASKLIVNVEKLFAERTDEDPHLGKPGIALTIINCEPSALCIVPDKCNIVYDRRLIPGETIEGAIKEIRDIADDIAKTDPDFRAEVSINKNVRSAYTGLREEIESKKDVWIIDREHPFIKACASGLEDAGQDVVYGYWPFSTDIPQVGSKMGKPCVGYSGSQEFYIHNGIEKVRLDYFKDSLKGNVSMFLKASEPGVL